MATRTITTITDDIDGSPDAEAHTFALNGKQYAIDLSAKNSEKLSKVLAPFIDKATVVRGVGAPAKKSSKGAERDYSIEQLREWAAKKKIEIPTRGRIPYAVVEQYKAEGGH